MTKIINEKLAAWLVFSLSLLLYLKTLAPTILLWDSAEWVTTAYTFGVSHPPGAPLYLLVARLFSLLPVSGEIAFRINLLSALCSAFSVFFVFRIVHLLLSLNDQKSGFIPLFAASFASLGLAFSHTFWLNAVGAEVYAPATMLVSIILYSLLLAHLYKNTAFKSRYLLLIFYLFGLSIGVHLIVLLILPAVVFFILKNSGMKSLLALLSAVCAFLVVYPGLVKWLPQLATNVGGWLFWLVPAALLLVLFVAIKLKNYNLQFLTIASLLIMLGFSTYFTVFIRSGMEPVINQGNPATIAEFSNYINRASYGNWDVLPRRYEPPLQNQNEITGTFNEFGKQLGFFLHYQLNHMYLRYFSWQFISPPNAQFVFIGGFFFILGIIGLWAHLRSDKDSASAYLFAFFCSSLLLVVYLNQSNPQPRERDYIYVFSFLIYFIWTGIGCAAVLQFLQTRFKVRNGILVFIAVLLFCLGPLLTLWQNYPSYGYSKNTFAQEFAENLLKTCEPDAILFTGGDNDTYPLWYAQQVCNIRTDVSVVNLSMLNDPGYAGQISPAVRTSGLRLYSAEKQPITLVLPATAKGDSNFVNIHLSMQTREISLQKQTAIDMLLSNSKTRPIYFAAGVGESDMVGLQNFLRLDGLAFRLVPNMTRHSTQVCIQTLADNLTAYHHRDSTRESHTMQEGAIAIIRQYQTAYMLLIENMLDAKEIERAILALKQFETHLPFERFSFTKNRLNMLVFYSRLYGYAGQAEDQLRLARLAVQYLPQNKAARDNLADALKLDS